MKQIDKMSRLTGELEKAFRLLNAEFFDGELPTPIITVIPTPRAYAHYVPFDIWSAKDTAKREINIASGTLDRPLENILASLVHEMTHIAVDFNPNTVTLKGDNGIMRFCFVTGVNIETAGSPLGDTVTLYCSIGERKASYTLIMR